jgi:protein-disulfide isomerase
MKYKITKLAGLLTSIVLMTFVSGCNDEKKIAEVVEKTLLENPKIIIDAVTKYQQDEQVKQTEKQQETINNASEKLNNDKHSLVLGNPDGDVTLVAFKDYRCGYCKKAWPILQELIAKDKNLRVIFKEYPVLGADSETAARFALASSLQGIDKYKALNEAFILHTGAYDAETLKEVAKSRGIDADKMQKDAGEKYVSDAITENMQLGAGLGIQGTPAFVVGKTVIPGAVPLDYLQEAIKKEREAAKAPVATDAKPAEDVTKAEEAKPAEDVKKAEEAKKAE